MKFDLIKIIIIFSIVWAGAFFSRSAGLYYSLWYTDVILHILSGIGFSYIGLLLIEKEKISYKLRFLFLVSLAVVGGFFWELWEFSGWHLVPSNMEFYDPNLGDSLGDIASGMAGGILFFIIAWLNSKRV